MQQVEFSKSEEAEPPSHSPILFIGQSRHGEWVVRDRSGLRGGLFVSRAEAFRFAKFENGYCTQAIILVPGFLELDMTSNSMAANDTERGADPAHRVSEP